MGNPIWELKEVFCRQGTRLRGSGKGLLNYSKNGSCLLSIVTKYQGIRCQSYIEGQAYDVCKLCLKVAIERDLAAADAQRLRQYNQAYQDLWKWELYQHLYGETRGWIAREVHLKPEDIVAWEKCKGHYGIDLTHHWLYVKKEYCAQRSQTR